MTQSLESKRALVRRRKAGRVAAPASRRNLLALFCAFAIAFQCIVVQGHFHAGRLSPQRLDAAASWAEPAADAVKQVQDETPAEGTASGCFICAQQALAGSAILPDAPAPMPADASIGSTAGAISILAALAPVSHNWLSRAPPTFL